MIDLVVAKIQFDQGFVVGQSIAEDAECGCIRCTDLIPFQP